MMNELVVAFVVRPEFYVFFLQKRKIDKDSA